MEKILASAFREELTRILDYWMRYTPDRERGGFYGKLNDDNQAVPGAVKGAVLNARILWSFSAAYNIENDAAYLTMAGRSIGYIMEHFIDKEYGGVYWSVTAEGAPADSKKQMYAIAFVIYGLAEYYRAQPMQEALDMAVRLYRDIETYSYDKERGGYMEALTRDWQPMADLRLSEKDANEKKTMNTHLHILEAYTNLYRVWPDVGLAGKIRGIIDVFREHIIDGGTGHLRLFFDEDWGVRSSVISYGHDIEASWLLVEAVEVLEGGGEVLEGGGEVLGEGDRGVAQVSEGGDQGARDGALLRQVREMSVRLAVAAAEGLNADGSMRYECDRGHMVDERHWWVQAEAMVGFLHAARVSGDAGFYRK
ncbi:MAG TPA: AGE family epimerase/isomerase, partial [Puia sp.]